MRLATVKVENKEAAAIILGDQAVLVETINEMENKSWSTDVLSVLQKGHLAEMVEWYETEGKSNWTAYPNVPVEEVAYAPLYRTPGKIWGVGMNYMEKAIELSGLPPEEDPVVFMKPATSLIGQGQAIELPAQAGKVTAEAELAIVIGETCKQVKAEEAMKVVAGFTTSLDMTAKDIHAKNPRYLQRSKSFDTFFSFGPQLLTVDEFADLNNLAVKTVLNGEVHHQNIVANMMYQPNWIVSFFSQIMTLHPGDIIMTGTPGSVVVRDGDIVECRIDPFEPLKNTVLEPIN